MVYWPYSPMPVMYSPSHFSNHSRAVPYTAKPVCNGHSGWLAFFLTWPVKPSGWALLA